jgi:hypothetical protein
MLQTIKDLGYKFSSEKEESFFIRTRCQLQQTEHKGRPVAKLYIDRVEVGTYEQ